MIKIKTVIFFAFFYVVQHSIASVTNCAVKAPSICLTNVPGPAVVKKLLDPSTLLSAHYELLRRNMGNLESYSYSEFLEYHYNEKCIFLPQAEGETPLYLVLTNSSDPSAVQEDIEYGELDYILEKPEELFQVKTRKREKNDPKPIYFEVFDNNGQIVEHFWRHNSIEPPAMLADLNNDGVLECANRINYDMTNDVDLVVLDIITISSKPQTLLAVVYNTDSFDDEWTFRCVDDDKDGIYDVVLGPLIEGQLMPKVVYTWDKTAKAYVGPEGKDGDHFRRLPSGDYSDELDKFAVKKLTFPPDTNLLEWKRIQGTKAWRRGKKIALSELSKPYQKMSFREMSDQTIIRYMGRGKAEWEFDRDWSIKTHVPTNFWTMEAKAAALEIVESNRYADHKKCYRLAIDDRDGSKPPDVCTLAFSYISDRSYHSTDNHFFIRADPKGSYLAFADLSDGGITLYNSEADTEFFVFKYCEMTYQEARQIVHTIWWLNRVRSYRDEVMPNIGSGSTTADGSGCLVLRDGDGQLLFKIERTIHVFGSVADMWDHNYNKRVVMNVVASMIYDGLLEELGERWSGAKDKAGDNFFKSVTNPAAYKAEQTTKTRELAGKFLNLFSADQTHLSIAVANVSSVAAGSLLCTNLVERLVELQEAIPPDTTKKRTYEEIEAELEPLKEALRKDDKNLELKNQVEGLEKELMAISRETGVEDVNALKAAIALAQKKLRYADDFQALQEWATSQTPGSKWAVQRLKAKDKTRNVADLEWLVKNTKDRWTQQSLEASTKVNPKRSEELAKEELPDRGSDLTISAFSHFNELKHIPDEQQRVRAIIKIARDPANKCEERCAALDLLVPAEQPLRFSYPEIDEALLALLDQKEEDKLNQQFVIAGACEGLARRKRVDCFDKLEAVLKETHNGVIFTSSMAAIIQLSKCDPEKFHRQLESLFRSIIKEGRFNFESLVMTAWSLDLRDLKHVFEGLATSSPEDYEFDWLNQTHPDVQPLPFRTHAARQVVALWEDNDSFTQCRLLIAFALSENYRVLSKTGGFLEELASKNFSTVDDAESGYLKALVKDLERSYCLLTVGEKRKIAVFCEYCKKNGLSDRDKSYLNHEDKKAYLKVYDRIRTVLNK